VLAFNAAVTRRAVDEAEGYAALAAPAAGSGIYLTQAQTLIYAQIARGTEVTTDAIATAIAQAFAKRGIKISANGQPVENADDTLAALRQEVAPTLAHWLPLWQQLGVI
jgi:hypothetical protein